MTFSPFVRFYGSDMPKFCVKSGDITLYARVFQIDRFSWFQAALQVVELGITAHKAPLNCCNIALVHALPLAALTKLCQN